MHNAWINACNIWQFSMHNFFNNAACGQKKIMLKFLEAQFVEQELEVMGLSSRKNMRKEMQTLNMQVSPFG